jgi:hypothetical protein
LIRWAAVMAALLVLGQSSLAQAPLGIGLVDVNFDDKTIIDFYDQPRSSSPTRTIKFFDDKAINSWSIVDLKSVRTWLVPESLWLDYNSFVFRCVSKRPGWLQVVVNNKTGKSYWIKSSPYLKFSTWEEFLKQMFSITRSRKFPQTVHAQPSPSTREVNYRVKDCFEVVEMRGDWIKVKQAGHCEVRDAGFRTGWIRWRRGQSLLVEYFITS